mgnify:CR=1 FL=1
MRVLPVLLFATLGSPAAQAMPLPLYGHEVDAIQDVLLTTAAPPETFQGDFSVGLATASETCAPNPAMTGALSAYHTHYMIAGQNRVNYDGQQPVLYAFAGLGGHLDLYA